MKVRVTLMTENDKSFESLGVSKEEMERQAMLGWQLIMDFLCLNHGKDPSERAIVEKCELVED